MKIWGALFKSKYKQEGDKKPDYTGNGRSEDKATAYEFAAWIKLDKNGNKYLSVLVKTKEEEKKPEDGAQASTQTQDDLPF